MYIFAVWCILNHCQSSASQRTPCTCDNLSKKPKRWRHIGRKTRIAKKKCKNAYHNFLGPFYIIYIRTISSHCLDWDLNDKRPGARSDNNFIFKKRNENWSIKEKNRSYGRFWIYQLISTANSALIPSNKAGLAVLISW